MADTGFDSPGEQAEDTGNMTIGDDKISGPMLSFIAPVLLFIAGCSNTAELAKASAGGAGSDVKIDAKACGAIDDGSTVNTTAIQTGIDSLSARGGGVLEFSAGRYVTGTIQLKSNVRLRLLDQAVLMGSRNAADYRNLDPFVSGDGVALGYALITAISASHVGIEGPGEINGQGRELKSAEGKFTVRPFLIRWEHCRDVQVRGVQLTNPGAWTMQFFQCDSVIADRVTIRSDNGVVNTDGIDIDSCDNTRVTGCDIESGDDAICVKTTSCQACTDLTISDCTLKTRCNAIKLGTESLGDFSRVSASHCRMHDIGMSGIALYSVDGANMHDITLSDLDMNGVAVPISIRLGSRLKTFRPGDLPRPIGSLHDVTIENIRAVGARRIGMLINGIPDHRVDSLHLKNINITVSGGGKATDAAVQLPEKKSDYPEMSMFGRIMPAYGVYLRHINGMTCDNVQIYTARADLRPPVILIDVKGVNANSFATTQPATDESLPGQ